MNYLAHIYLSGHSPETIIGNFIADAVKGKQYLNYTDGIIKGIKLHRFIDDFTDKHPIVGESKKRLRNGFGKYAGVVVDVFYDHFLARNFHLFSETKLEIFTQNTYKLLSREAAGFPEKVQFMLPYMVKQDWLCNYKEVEGIHRALSGMAKRTSFQSNMEFASEALLQHYDNYESEFLVFFPELVENAKNFLK